MTAWMFASEYSGIAAWIAAGSRQRARPGRVPEDAGARRELVRDEGADRGLHRRIEGRRIGLEQRHAIALQPDCLGDRDVLVQEAHQERSEEPFVQDLGERSLAHLEAERACPAEAMRRVVGEAPKSERLGREGDVLDHQALLEPANLQHVRLELVDRADATIVDVVVQVPALGLPEPGHAGRRA